MGLADIAKNPPTADAPWRTCQVCHLMANLDKAERAGLHKMLSDSRWRFTQIQQAIEHEGHKVDYSAIRRHVRGRCAAGVRLR